MAIHAKTDSDLSTLATSSPPRSPRRPTPYAMSPINRTDEVSPNESPIHQRYASSPLHHSRELSTTCFSVTHKNGYWKRIPLEMKFHGGDEGEEEEEDDEKWGIRCYAFMFVIGFFFVFSLFSIILWGASKAHGPKIIVQSVAWESFNIQAGIDLNGVPTEMMSINSTVKMRFRNAASFFGVHVSSTPLYLYYYDLLVASGHMREFYSPRKNQRLVSTVVVGTQVPLYGGGIGIIGNKDNGPDTAILFNLSFVVRSRADVLGKLVRSNFNRRVRCTVYLHESNLVRPIDLGRTCQYE